MNTTPIITEIEKTKRTQILMAMESLVKTMGGRDAYIAWLSAMPAEAGLNLSGGMDQRTARAVAENTDAYRKMLKAFETSMVPVIKDEANL